MTTKQMIAARFKWLKGRDMTIRQFSNSISLDYNTVVRWFERVKMPRDLYRRAIAAEYPDFPGAQ